MQNFDVALKEIFQTIGTSLTEKLAGAAPAEWLNVELPETRNPRADFVCRLVNGLLFHMEFASYNDAELIWRMLDYLSMLRKKYGQAPRQVVLYMGRDPLRMPNRIEEADENGNLLVYQARMLDLGDLDAEELLAGERIGDVILAVLNRHADPKRTLQRILDRIVRLEPEQRMRACRLLVILSAKRNLSDTVIEGVKEMGLLIDPMEDTFFRRLYEKGLREGEEKGREQGREQGEASLLLRMLRHKFGVVPTASEERINSATPAQLELWSDRLFTANAIEDILA